METAVESKRAALSPCAATAREARQQAGLSEEAAAKRARVCVRTLRQVETGCLTPSERLARNLATQYGCKMEIFLPSDPHGPKGKRKSGRLDGPCKVSARRNGNSAAQ